MLDDDLRAQLADWVRPVASLPVPDIRVLRRRARRRGTRRAAAAAVITAAVAVAVVITTSLPGAGRPAGSRPAPGGSPSWPAASSWPAAPGTWNRGAWQPAGALPAAGAGPAVAPHIVIPRFPGVAQVRNVFTGTTIATVKAPPGQSFAAAAGAGDDRTFVLQAEMGGHLQDGREPAVGFTTVAFDELRLRPDGRPESLRLLFTIPSAGGVPFAISQDASMLAYMDNNGFETVSLATGTGRSWPAVDAGAVGGLSWAGDRTLAFEWGSADNPHPPGIGIRVLDVTAPGDLLQASRLVVAYSRYCGTPGGWGCLGEPVITPDGTRVMVPKGVCLRVCSGTAEMSSGVFTDSVVEYSTRTGQVIADVAPPVTSLYPGVLCVPIWTDPSGEQVASSCGHTELYDRGRVRPITLHIPMYGTDIVGFGWQPGSAGT